MLCTFFVTCNKDDDTGGSNNGLKSGQIEFKAYPGEDNKISFNAKAKKITIDWGDGIINEFTPNGIEREFVHEYTNQNFQTVSFVTESITSISFERPLIVGQWQWQDLHELRFGKCVDLKEVRGCSRRSLTVLDIKNAVASLEILECNNNQLTSLDVSGASKLKRLWCSDNILEELKIKGCTSLTTLWCRRNQLSTSVINQLFNDLPTISADYSISGHGQLDVSRNPGDVDCDKSIAEKKGWYFSQ